MRQLIALVMDLDPKDVPARQVASWCYLYRIDYPETGRPYTCADILSLLLSTDQYFATAEGTYKGFLNRTSWLILGNRQSAVYITYWVHRLGACRGRMECLDAEKKRITSGMLGAMKRPVGNTCQGILAAHQNAPASFPAEK